MFLTQKNRVGLNGEAVGRNATSTIATVTLALVASALPLSAFGQTSYFEATFPHVPFYQPVSPYPVEMGATYDHDSTAIGNFLTGQARKIQALGLYKLCETQSWILAEQAKWLNRLNRWKQIEYRLAIQKVNQEQFEAVRLYNVALRARVNRLAYELTAHQLDPTTGIIIWPELLLAEQYDVHRQRLELLLRSYFGYQATNQLAAAEIVKEAELLKRELQRDRAMFDRDAYLAAHKFVCGVKFAPLFAGASSVS